MTNESKKYDEGKPRWELVPLDVIQQVAVILTYGAQKYGANNWQGLDDAEDRYWAACMRHMTEHRSGNYNDEESGLPHVFHALTSLIMFSWHAMREKNVK